MKTTRQAVAVVLAAVLGLVVLSGCGGDGDGQDAARDQADSTARADEGSTAATTDGTAGEAATPAPSIGEIVWATAVQPDTNAATAVVARFPVDAPALYAVVLVTGLPSGAVLTARWTYNDVPLDALEAAVEIPTPVDGTAWVEFHLDRDEESWPEGTYEISIWLNGEPVRTSSVVVGGQG